jgi:hypothetical protein
MKQKTPPPEPIRGGPNPEELKRVFTFGFEGKFGKSVSDLPVVDRHLINALRRFYAYRHNGYLLTEAMDICVRNIVNPPTWVLIAINEGLQRFSQGNASLARALHMGKRDREEYDQYRQQQPLMVKVLERLDRDGIKAACTHVSNQHHAATGKDVRPDTLEKQYNRMWRGFHDFVEGK